MVYTSIHVYVRNNPTTDPPGAELLCRTCGMFKSPEHFYLRNARKRFAAHGSSRGACPKCRDCQKLTTAGYREPRKQIISDAKAGGCVQCGLVDLDHPEIFDFDHVLPGKVKTITLWQTSGTVEDLLAEIARCEVVCSNCHRIRTKARTNGKVGWDLRQPQ